MIGSVIEYARRPALAAATDGQLLARFLRSRDGPAFAALVGRHGPMVLGVCRRVLGDRHDAEDAFQATFLTLARKAPSVVPRELVGNWLYGVAYRTALKARTAAGRRRARERRAASARVEATPPADHDLRGVIDHELSRLPAVYRAAVVLCDLDGCPRAEAALQLGVSEGTVSSRLARGRGLLARRLAARGLAPAAAAALLTHGAARAAVPGPLLASTTTAAAAAAALIDGGHRIMLLSGLKFAAVSLAALGVGVAGLTTDTPDDRKPAAKPAAGKPDPKPADAGKKPQGPTLTGTVVSVEAGPCTITLKVQPDPAKKETANTTLPFAKDLKVVLEHGLKKETREGLLADLTPGTPVSAQLSPDRKTVLAVHAHGGSAHGVVKSVDAGRNTVTVSGKGADGPRDQTFELESGAKVTLDDGIGAKGTAAKEGKLTDLSEGLSVVVQLSGYDRSKAVAVHATGPNVAGVLKGVDTSAGTVTVTLKEDGSVIEKTFALSKDAKIEGGNLGDLVGGTGVSLRLSVRDRQTVVALRSLGK
jgi:RNA polymerase sigma factor (sigma-70 family)